MVSNHMSLVSSPIIVALDYPGAAQALSMARQLDPAQCRVKVGKELFTRAGPKIVDDLHGMGFEIFLDLKFHDIPTTTAKAVISAAELGVWMVNLHASAGSKAMQLSKRMLDEGGFKTKLIGVTVLTSMSEADLAETGVTRSIADQVSHLAALTQKSGLHGVVCSAQEASMLKAELGEGFLKVTPGIRMASDERSDQTRVCTPREALEQGATHLVIGRSITGASNPSAALKLVLESIG